MSPVRFAIPRTAVMMLGLLTTSLSITGQAPKPLKMNQPLMDKNFYLLSLLQQDSRVQKALAADAALSAVTQERQRILSAGVKSCKDNGGCMVKALVWTDEEIDAVARALQQAEEKDASLRALVQGPLRTSGAYVLEQPLGDAAQLSAAWRISVRGINHVLQVYGAGDAPRYQAVDSLMVDAKSPEYQAWLISMIQPLASDTSDSFFEPSLKAALSLLEKNHRDEAGRLEPMETGINAAAVRAVPTVHWKNYPYTVIVVPGAGPNDRETALSANGHERTRLAVEAYRAGKAPFIMVSGGYVHPAQTRFAEAVEMKRALIDEFHLPESAILSDPHARHTTTNMRNAARLIYRYGIPMDRPALVISDAAQAGGIASQVFADRCMREMGYVPFRILKQTAPTETEFLPRGEALEEDPIDPLDP